LNDRENVGPVRRPRTWYKRRLRNRRIMLVVALAAVAAVGAWFVFSRSSESDEESTDQASVPRATHETPEEIGKLAEQGDAQAQWRYGVLYREGDGIRQSDSEAVEWFLKSAEHEFVPAATALGEQYWAGRGVKQDYNKAYFWYDVALAEGDESANPKLKQLSGELTPEEVASVHQRAAAWLQAHGGKGHPQ